MAVNLTILNEKLIFFLHCFGLYVFPVAAISNSVILTDLQQIRRKFLFINMRREVHVFLRQPKYVRDSYLVNRTNENR